MSPMIGYQKSLMLLGTAGGGSDEDISAERHMHMERFARLHLAPPRPMQVWSRGGTASCGCRLQSRSPSDQLNPIQRAGGSCSVMFYWTTNSQHVLGSSLRLGRNRSGAEGLARDSGRGQKLAPTGYSSAMVGTGEIGDGRGGRHDRKRCKGRSN